MNLILANRSIQWPKIIFHFYSDTKPMKIHFYSSVFFIFVFFFSSVNNQNDWRNERCTEPWRHFVVIFRLLCHVWSILQPCVSFPFYALFFVMQIEHWTNKPIKWIMKATLFSYPKASEKQKKQAFAFELAINVQRWLCLLSFSMNIWFTTC